MPLTSCDKIVKDVNFWFTLVEWLFCVTIICMVFIGKSYTITKLADKCITIFGIAFCPVYPTLPKLGLLLVATSAPLYTVITTGLLANYFFDENFPKPKLNLIFTIVGFITFTTVTICAFQFTDMLDDPGFANVCLYCADGVVFLINAIYVGYTLIKS